MQLLAMLMPSRSTRHWRSAGQSIVYTEPFETVPYAQVVRSKNGLQEVLLHTLFPSASVQKLQFDLSRSQLDAVSFQVQQYLA